MPKQLLSGIYLFKELPHDEVDHLTRIARAEHLSAGQVIFSPGDAATAMYVIKYGSVRLERETASGDSMLISLMASGNHFGETGLVERGIRGVRATAVESTELVLLSYSDLTKVFNENALIAAHFYKALAHSLVGRLKETTKDLTHFRSKF